MSGEAAALGCAFFWALSSALIRELTQVMPSLSLNAARSALGAVLNILAVLAFPRVILVQGAYWRNLGLLLINLSIGIVIGDSLYYSSMRLIGVARALTISSVYPLLTAMFSSVLLGEYLEPKGWAGFILCIGGVILVTRSASPQGQPAASKQALRGAALAVGAALCWSIGTVALRLGSVGLTPFLVNSFRLTGVAIIASLLAAGRREMISLRALNGRSVLLLLGSAVTGSLAGASLYVRAVQLAGAGKAALLASTAPLFSVPFALAGGERVNAQLLTGMVVAICGMALVL